MEPNPPADPGDASPHDVLRRKYLKALSEYTGRATIVYATAFLESKPAQGAAYTINLGDIQGMMEVCSNISDRKLDLILTSPGGSPEAAESLMSYLRTRFDHIRVLVPVAAKSAATMMALAADEIVMGSYSQLGPIDPQFTVYTPEGPREAPGQAILDQFEQAKLECQNPANLAAWLPMLRSLLPGLIAQCGHQRALAEEFATRSLEAYMFKGHAEAAKLAATAAAWFSDFSAFRSHGRRVSKQDAEALQLNVTSLEDDKKLQDLVLSVHHAVRHTFSGTGTTKIFENHHGRAYIESQAVQVIQQAGPIQLPGQRLAPAPAPQQVPAGSLVNPLGIASAPRPNRAERRKQGRNK